MTKIGAVDSERRKFGSLGLMDWGYMGEGCVCGGLEVENDGACAVEERPVVTHQQPRMDLAFDSSFSNNTCFMLTPGEDQ